MAVNKVILGNKTLLDVSNDTVTPPALADGVTAHSANGAIIVGTATPVTLEQTLGENTKAVVSQKAITDIISRKEQLRPEFANNIEECTDTSALYVLPDGYIYAYMTKEAALFTDQIKNGVSVDGTPFNGGKGLEIGYISSNGAVSAGNGVEFYSGFIPYSLENTIKISGLDETTDLSSGQHLGRLFFYAEDKTTNIKSDFLDVFSKEGSAVYEPQGYDGHGVFTFDLSEYTRLHGWYGSEIASKAKYIRVGWYRHPHIESALVLFNQDIAFDTVSEWTNTGHQFVPADCEERIIPLEESSANHESRIKALEMYGSDSTSSSDIPAYIKTEADGVMARVIEKQGNRSFNFVGISDFHYGGTGDNKDNLIRASKAISYIIGRMHIDAVATLGDNAPFGSTYSDEDRARADRWYKEMNEIIRMTQMPGVVDFRTPGNHDKFGTETEFMPDNATYSFISGYNSQCDYVNAPIGYAYKDFKGYKLRVIVLNTAETEGKGRFSIHSGYHIGNAQYQWLIKTLDMSSKEDASEWQILILSHHRADDWQVPTDGSSDSQNAYILPQILNAYKTGGSYAGTITADNISVSCNFAGKNQARLIGQIHGHHHAYYYQNLYLGAVTNSNQSGVMAVSTPTSGFGTGEGHNDDNNGNWYDSVKDTAAETAFCLYSIDLDNHKIYAIHYGNGLDREISY